MEYPGDHWLGYDQRFRQRAAVTTTTKWSKIDTTLWHLAFAGRSSIARCKYCFSITHCSRDCELAPDPDPPAQEQPAAPSRRSAAVPSRRPICFAAAPEKTTSLSTFPISVPETLVSATRTTKPPWTCQTSAPYLQVASGE